MGARTTQSCSVSLRPLSLPVKLLVVKVTPAGNTVFRQSPLAMGLGTVIGPLLTSHSLQAPREDQFFFVFYIFIWQCWVLIAARGTFF